MPRARIALAAAGLLAGCSFAPAYRLQPLPSPAPAAFREDAPLAPAGWTAATPQDAIARGAWWEMFGDPVLNELEAGAATASPTLAAAVARYDAARAAVREAGADLLPTIGADASIVRERVSGKRPLANSGPVTYDDKIVEGTFDYEVDLWGRVRNEVSATRADAQASAADLENARLSLQAQLADAYFQLRGLDAQRQLLERNVAAYARARDLTVTRHDGGVANGLDVNRAATVLSSARAQISDVARARSVIEHQIAALVGQLPSSFTLAAAVQPFAPPAIPAGAPSELLQRRPDVAEAERRAFAANRRIGVARAAWFPSLSLSAGGGYNSSKGGLLADPATFWTLGPALLAQTIFDGGRRAAQVRISRAQYDEAASDYRAAVLTAFQQVEDTIAAAHWLARQSIDQRAAADAARRTEQLALTRYRDGASDYLDVVTAQTDALAAERAALQVQTQRMQAAIALVRSLGGDYRSGTTAPATAMP